MTMTDIERLMAIEEIKQLKARFYRFLDTGDWEGFESVFTEDAVMDLRIPDRILVTEEGLYVGAKAIAAFARKAIGGGQSIDHALMPEIEIVAPTEARGIWVQEDRVTWPEGHPNRSMHGFGYEHETYQRIDGRWRISSHKLVRLRVDVVRSP